MSTGTGPNETGAGSAPVPPPPQYRPSPPVYQPRYVQPDTASAPSTHYVNPRYAPAHLSQPAPLVQQPVAPQTVVVQQVVTAEKSVAAAVILSFFFGPLGMLYSTVVGAAVMFGVNLLAIFLTWSLGLFLTWPACVIWAGVAASQHNDRVRRLTGVWPR